MEIKITCEERWYKAQKLANEHYDDSLDRCVINLMHHMHANSDVKQIVISADFCENCFFFSEFDKDGNAGLCGGIIFHGYPEDGYQENGSVMISPSYGWQIHT